MNRGDYCFRSVLVVIVRPVGERKFNRDRCRLKTGSTLANPISKGRQIRGLNFCVYARARGGRKWMAVYRKARQLDKITGTLVWHQVDPPDGIKFSFAARSRVTNYRHP